MSEKEKQEEKVSDEQKRATLAIKKFYSLEKDATMLLYKLAMFAEKEPEKYKYMKGLLDKEIADLKKK